MSLLPKPQEIYKHFKGNLYQIITIAEHSETGEQLVIYQALYGDFRIYARPLDMFVSRVDRTKYPDAAQEYRFELQGSSKGQDDSASQGSLLLQDEPKMQEVPEVQDGLDEPDPMLIEFLDADSYEQRLNILVGLGHRITDDMITTMAIACDIELNEGETLERYEALKHCLITLEKYECNRLR